MYERTVSAFDRVRITPLQYTVREKKLYPEGGGIGTPSGHDRAMLRPSARPLRALLPVRGLSRRLPPAAGNAARLRFLHIMQTCEKSPRRI